MKNVKNIFSDSFFSHAMQHHSCLKPLLLLQYIGDCYLLQYSYEKQSFSSRDSFWGHHLIRGLDQHAFPPISSISGVWLWLPLARDLSGAQHPCWVTKFWTIPVFSSAIVRWAFRWWISSAVHRITIDDSLTAVLCLHPVPGLLPLLMVSPSNITNWVAPPGIISFPSTETRRFTLHGLTDKLKLH